MGKWIKIDLPELQRQYKDARDFKIPWTQKDAPGIRKDSLGLPIKEKGHYQAIIETENAKES